MAGAAKKKDLRPISDRILFTIRRILLVRGSLEESLEECRGNQIKKSMLSVGIFWNLLEIANMLEILEVRVAILNSLRKETDSQLSLGGGGG